MSVNRKESIHWEEGSKLKLGGRGEVAIAPLIKPSDGLPRRTELEGDPLAQCPDGWIEAIRVSTRVRQER